MNRILKKLLKSKRAVSPVVAVVLLIGVVVVGIVAVFVLFNLLTAPSTVLEVQSVDEIDRNGDGLIDGFEITVINTGTGPAAVTDITVAFTVPAGKTGFTLSSTVAEVGANPVTLKYQTSDVDAQLPNEIDYTIEVSYKGSLLTTITQDSDLLDAKVTDPQNPQNFVVDNADGNWAGSSGNGGSVQILTTDSNAQHSGQTGIRLRLDANKNYYYWRVDSSVSVNSGNGIYPQTNDLTKSPETIDFNSKKVLVFWVRFSTTNIGNTLDAWVYFRTYSGSTVQATRAVQFITNGQFVSGKAFSTATVGNDWVRIVIDLSDLSGYNPSSDGNTLAFFGLRFQQASSTYYAYIDDIGVYEGL